LTYTLFWLHFCTTLI